MWQDAHDAYLESRVLSADPIELVRMLYESAARGVENARRHLANGDIAARARSISHASAVLIELASSLDHERGGKISANLAQLYDYMLRRLTEANLQQSDPPLAEVEQLLATLSEGWQEVKSQSVTQPETARQPAPEPASWTQVGAQEAAATESSWASYGGAGEQPTAFESNSYERPWETPATPEPVRQAIPLEQPMAVERPAASAEPDPANLNPWLTASPSPWEPTPAYGPSWANLVAQETAGSYTQHDWSA